MAPSPPDAESTVKAEIVPPDEFTTYANFPAGSRWTRPSREGRARHRAQSSGRRVTTNPTTLLLLKLAV
jgi:hypothetical protein